MNSSLFDASALIKRYTNEVGAALVDHFFASADPTRLVCLMLGVAEVAAVLARKRNGGLITAPVFAAMMTQFRAEVIEAADFAKLPADNALINSSLALSDQYAINATDAIILRAALDLAAYLRLGGDDLVLVSSDQRLLKAAQAEGLLAFDPETQTEAALNALLRA
jgi:predicted nucleic acid-binding protein